MNSRSYTLPFRRALYTGSALLLIFACCNKSTASFRIEQSNTLICLPLDNRYASVYLNRDAEWDDTKTTRMVLHNNSKCPITIMTDGKQTVLKYKAVTHVLSDIAENGALVTLQYKVNNYKTPWAFVTYWPYGDIVSSLKLSGGHSVKFIVKSDQLASKRQIAVPFYYEWEDIKHRSGIEHLVYSIPE